MITPNNIKPEKSLYFLGSHTINFLNNTKKREVNSDELFLYLNSVLKEKITYSYFVYVLDWLFLVGVIKESRLNNNIKKCF